MLLKLFKNNHPFVLFLIPVLGFLLWMPSLIDFPFKFPEIVPHKHTPVFDWLTEPLASYPNLSVIIALAFLILQSFLLIRLNFKHIFIESRTYLPSVLFVISISATSSGFSCKLFPFMGARQGACYRQRKQSD
jgi:hypothetical protein